MTTNIEYLRMVDSRLSGISGTLAFGLRPENELNREKDRLQAAWDDVRSKLNDAEYAQYLEIAAKSVQKMDLYKVQKEMDKNKDKPSI